MYTSNRGGRKAESTKMTLAALAYGEIKKLILSGELQGGERISERDLTARLNVSRTPLREALKQLARDGLVFSKPQSGHFIQKFDITTVEDLYELREVLERRAITLAIARMSEGDREELRAVKRVLRRYDGQKEQSSRELEDGQRVHDLIAGYSRDVFLQETLERLYDRLQLFVWIDALFEDDAALTRREHRDLIDAIVRVDVKASLEAARRHARRSHENVRRVIDRQAARKASKPGRIRL